MVERCTSILSQNNFFAPPFFGDYQVAVASFGKPRTTDQYQLGELISCKIIYRLFDIAHQ